MIALALAPQNSGTQRMGVRAYCQWRDTFGGQLAGFFSGHSRSPRSLANELTGLVSDSMSGPDAELMLTVLRSVARANSRTDVSYAVLRAVSDAVPRDEARL